MEQNNDILMTLMEEMPQTVEEEPISRGWFHNFISRLPIIGKVIKRAQKNSAATFETYSKFKRFFDAMDAEDPLYPSVRQTSGLCDDALRIAKQRIQLGTRLQE